MLRIFCKHQAFEGHKKQQWRGVQYNSFITSKRLNQAALNSPKEISFLYILFIQGAVIHHSLLISLKTIGGSLWLSQAQIQLLV